MTVHGGWKDRSSDARKIGVFFPVDFSLLCELLLFWCLAVSIIDVPVRYMPRKREGEGFDVVFANWGKRVHRASSSRVKKVRQMQMSKCLKEHVNKLPRILMFIHLELMLLTELHKLSNSHRLKGASFESSLEMF